MSVHGELSRHLDGLLARLEEADRGPRARALREALLAARPREGAELSASAERILDALADCGLDRDAEAPAPEEFTAESVDAAGTLAELSRIVLGR
jgi:hypothetical protein